MKLAQEIAWEIYIELTTRITTKPLADKEGDEQSALDSIYTVYKLIREIIKKNPPYYDKRAHNIAIKILDTIRPFTSKWHPLTLEGAFDQSIKHKESRKEFREELKVLQNQLIEYATILRGIAAIKDTK